MRSTCPLKFFVSQSLASAKTKPKKYFCQSSIPRHILAAAIACVFLLALAYVWLEPKPSVVAILEQPS
jgi:hypothetical protein